MSKQAHRQLESLKRALEEWRLHNSAPTPIPEKIWRQASQLSEQLGVSTVANELRLHHGKLKRFAQEKLPEATFVELTRPPQPFTDSRYLVEVQAPSGSLLRAELQGLTPQDFGLVLRSFGG